MLRRVYSRNVGATTWSGRERKRIPTDLLKPRENVPDRVLSSSRPLPQHTCILAYHPCCTNGSTVGIMKQTRIVVVTAHKWKKDQDQGIEPFLDDATVLRLGPASYEHHLLAFCLDKSTSVPFRDVAPGHFVVLAVLYQGEDPS